MIQEVTIFITDDGERFEDITEAMLHQDLTDIVAYLLKHSPNSLAGESQAEKRLFARSIAVKLLEEYDIQENT